MPQKKIYFTVISIFICILVSAQSNAKSKGDSAEALTKVSRNAVVSPSQPGFFNLTQSTNEKLCTAFAHTLNDDISKYGKPRFEKHKQFIRWRDVEEERLDRGAKKYDGQIEQAEADIDNDGLTDEVFRSKWSIGGGLNDALTVLSDDVSRKIEIDRLLNSEKIIMFNAGTHQKSQGVMERSDQSRDWYFDGNASLDLMKYGKSTYVVAYNNPAAKNVSAKAYVFQLDRNFKETNVCMLVKICPCEGCSDTPDNGADTSPSKKWCRK